MIMKLSFLLERLKPRHVIIASFLLAIINVLLNLLASAHYKVLFNATFEFITSILVACLLSYMWLFTRRKSFSISRIIKWMAFTVVAWCIGDGLYLYFEIIGKDQFFSIIDIVYIIATLLAVLLVLKIPDSQSVNPRWHMILLEISILILSASVLFAVLLFLPRNPYLGYDFLSLFLIVIYPVLDIIILWVSLILYFSYPKWQIQKVLGAIFIGAVFLFVSDFFYLVNGLYETIFSDFLIDLGYFFFYVWIFIAGLYGFQEIKGTFSEAKKEVSAFQKGNWMIFVPGFLLVIVISLILLLVLSNPLPIFNALLIVIGIIVSLFLIHQYLIIQENRKLNSEMQLINQQLEGLIEIRTTELEKTNADLKSEMNERKKTEQILAKTNQELDLLNKDKDKFFSILAHDLRNPLGAIMALSNLLIESVNDFNKNELLEITSSLNKSATQTYKLLNDLLLWSTAQMSSTGDVKVLFLIEDIINENIIVCSSAAEEKKIRIKTEIPTGLKAYADKFAMQTVIRNLLGNAIKFSFHNGEIIIKAEMVGGQLKVSVTDQGLGISESVQKKLFRIDSISSRKGTDGEKGTGFGLLLCKDIVEKNGGVLGLQSELNKGSTFYFTIPMGSESISTNNSDIVELVNTSHYYIDFSLNIAFTTIAGKYTANDLMKELKSIWQNVDYNPNIHSVVDLRKAVFNFDFSDMPKLLKFFKSMPGNRIKRKFALLTTTPQQVAYSTVFKQNTMEKYPIIIEIFTTSENAIKWLKN